MLWIMRKGGLIGILKVSYKVVCFDEAGIEAVPLSCHCCAESG